MESSPPDWRLAVAPLLQRAGRVIESEITGTSMGSTLPPGTRIRIHCEDPGSAKPGAVVAVMTDRGLIGHRLIWRGVDRKGRSIALTRGDGLTVCDPPAVTDRFLGEITEWYSAAAWRPVPGAPPTSWLRRCAAMSMLLAVRCGLAIDVSVATRLTGLFEALDRRLFRRSAGA